jgi:hypothetical protein
VGGQLNERHVHEQIQGPSPPAVLSTECLPASLQDRGSVWQCHQNIGQPLDTHVVVLPDLITTC